MSQHHFAHLAALCGIFLNCMPLAASVGETARPDIVLILSDNEVVMPNDLEVARGEMKFVKLKRDVSKSPLK